MCVNKPVSFQSDVPIKAYKLMALFVEADGCCIVQSILAGNKYIIGETYLAENPLQPVVTRCIEYATGFHAYENLEDTQKLIVIYPSRKVVVVEVELSQLTHKGTEFDVFPVYVAQECEFVQVSILTPEYRQKVKRSN